MAHLDLDLLRGFVAYLASTPRISEEDAPLRGLIKNGEWVRKGGGQVFRVTITGPADDAVSMLNRVRPIAIEGSRTVDGSNLRTDLRATAARAYVLRRRITG